MCHHVIDCNTLRDDTQIEFRCSIMPNHTYMYSVHIMEEKKINLLDKN